MDGGYTDSDAEVDRRIGAASKVIGAMGNKVIDRRELNKATKLMWALD